MNKYLYVFNTWLIANLIHPVMLVLLWMFLTNDPDITGFGNPGLQVIMPVIGILFLMSIPCLILSWIVISHIVKAPFSMFGRMIIWMIVSSLIIFLYFLILHNMSGWGFRLEELVFLFAPVMSTWTSILIRLRQFVNMALHVPDFSEKQNSNE